MAGELTKTCGLMGWARMG